MTNVSRLRVYVVLLVTLMTINVAALAQDIPTDTINVVALAQDIPMDTINVAALAQDIPTDSVIVAESLSPDILTVVDSITASYDSEWKDLSMQGKLSFDGLAIRSNVKIYMRRGESIILSARAPIFGEVARVEISQDSITCINKHSRLYCSSSLDSVAPSIIADIQDILLGQVALPGVGRITDEIVSDSEWIDIPEQGVMLYPSSNLQMKGMECAFIMDPESWQMLSFALLLTRVSTLLETTYLYGESGWTLGLRFSLGNKSPLNGKLELSYPDYEPTPMTFTDAGTKYRKTDFKGLMRF